MHALKVAPVAARMIVALVVSAILLAAAAMFAATPSSTPKVATAMSAECRQAYEGYAGSTDPAESDFWAESWMTFGCESGGYWA